MRVKLELARHSWFVEAGLLTFYLTRAPRRTPVPFFWEWSRPDNRGRRELEVAWRTWELYWTWRIIRGSSGVDADKPPEETGEMASR